MTSAQATLAALLKRQGYSITKPRLAVFDALLGQEPLSMHELVARTQKQGIDRASVYRTAALFEALGIVLRVNIGWKYKLELSEVFSDHHHHLSCVSCGTIIPLNEQSLEETITQLSRAQGFQPLSHQIEIQGYCQTCQEKR